MNKLLRPIPYPIGSDRRRNRIASSLRYGWATNYREAVAQVVTANRRARNTPMPGERCGAKTRHGTSCVAKSMANGRCKNHGGKSTGPKTAKGKQQSAANLPNSEHCAQAHHGLCASCTHRHVMRFGSNTNEHTTTKGVTGNGKEKD